MTMFHEKTKANGNDNYEAYWLCADLEIARSSFETGQGNGVL